MDRFEFTCHYITPEAGRILYDAKQHNINRPEADAAQLLQDEKRIFKSLLERGRAPPADARSPTAPSRSSPCGAALKRSYSAVAIDLDSPPPRQGRGSSSASSSAAPDAGLPRAAAGIGPDDDVDFDDAVLLEEDFHNENPGL